MQTCAHTTVGVCMIAHVPHSQSLPQQQTPSEFCLPLPPEVLSNPGKQKADETLHRTTKDNLLQIPTYTQLPTVYIGPCTHMLSWPVAGDL